MAKIISENILTFLKSAICFGITVKFTDWLNHNSADGLREEISEFSFFKFMVWGTFLAAPCCFVGMHLHSSAFKVILGSIFEFSVLFLHHVTTFAISKPNIQFRRGEKGREHNNKFN